MLWSEILIFLFAGAMAGTLAGLMGIGGGVIYVPLYLWFFAQHPLPHSLAPLVSVSTSLLVIFPSILISGYTHYQAGNLRIRPLKGLILSGIFGALAATLALRYISADPFKTVLGLFQLYLGGLFVFGNAMHHQEQSTKTWRFWGIGAIAGWISGFFGVGGGMLVTPLLHLSAGFSLPAAVGTATGFMIFSVGVSLLSYFTQSLSVDYEIAGLWGSFYLPAVGAILPTAFVFSRIGALSVGRVPAHKLKKAFGCLVMALGLYSISQGLRGLLT